VIKIRLARGSRSHGNSNCILVNARFFGGHCPWACLVNALCLPCSDKSVSPAQARLSDSLERACRGLDPAVSRATNRTARLPAGPPAASSIARSRLSVDDSRKSYSYHFSLRQRQDRHQNCRVQLSFAGRQELHIRTYELLYGARQLHSGAVKGSASTTELVAMRSLLPKSVAPPGQGGGGRNSKSLPGRRSRHVTQACKVCRQIKAKVRSHPELPVLVIYPATMTDKSTA